MYMIFLSWGGYKLDPIGIIGDVSGMGGVEGVEGMGE